MFVYKKNGKYRKCNTLTNAWHLILSVGYLQSFSWHIVHMITDSEKKRNKR